MIAVLALIVFLQAALVGIAVLLLLIGSRLARSLDRFHATWQDEMAQRIRHVDAAAEIGVAQMHVVGRGVAAEIACAADRVEAALHDHVSAGSRGVEVSGWPPGGRRSPVRPRPERPLRLPLSDDDETPPSGYAIGTIEQTRTDSQ